MAKFKLKGVNFNGSTSFYVQIATPLHRHEVCYLHTIKLLGNTRTHTHTTRPLLQHIVSDIDRCNINKKRYFLKKSSMPIT